MRKKTGILAMMALAILGLTAGLVLAGCGSQPAAPVKPARTDVEAFVQEAVDYANTQGKEAALAEFSNLNGSFERGELYIYAYDFSGTVLAHGGDPALVGKNLINYQDPAGFYVIQALIEKARTGSGWVSYTWDNPQTGRQDPKLGYVMKVDDNWWLGSGIYE